MQHLIKLLSLLVNTWIVLSFIQLSGLAYKPENINDIDSSQLYAPLLKQTEPTLIPILERQGVLEEGDWIVGEDEIRVDGYVIQGQAGETITIEVNSSSFTPFIVLADITSNLVVGSSTGESGTASLSLNLPSSGTYSVMVGPIASQAPGQGSYLLTVGMSGETARQLSAANQLLTQGHELLRYGQFQEARLKWEEALQISRRIGNPVREGAILSSLGRLHTSLGQYQKAIEFYEQHLTLAQETLGDTLTEGNTRVYLAYIYLALGQHQQALELLQESLEIARAMRNQDLESGALFGLGNLYLDLEQYEKAIDAYEQSLEIAEEIENDGAQGIALGGLGSAYLNLSQYQRAIDLYEQSTNIARRIGDRESISRDLNNLGVTYLLAQEYTKAEAVLREAVDVLEDLRTSDLSDTDTVSLLDIQQNTFNLLQRALVYQKKYEAALQIAERGRAQALAKLLNQQLVNDENSVVELHGGVEKFGTFAEREKVFLVEYSLVSESELYIWIISPDGEISFKQQFLPDTDLIALVNESQQAIGVRGNRTSAAPQLRPQELARQQAERDEKLSQLHDILIEPVADLLPTDPKQSVVFIPQSELFLVPFPALKDDNGDYLIENHTILTAPSIQVLQLTHEIATARDGGTTDKPVVVGNPTMPTVTFLTDEGEFVDTQLSPLSGALKEANAVSEFLDTPALTGDRATEATVKQQLASADLIHLATHGLLEYGDPRETGTRDVPGAIALAPGGGEDGLLTSAEILQMDLQADLVVLSACDTGRGRITGDGVIGLSRSFIAAGVPSIIVSLWSVPDAPTAELMTEFYRQLDQGQTKAQALRQAMLITMQTHPDPKDWAAFTLIGESE